MSDFTHDVICLSHLRWGFVFQRPNHLMSRCAAERRVYFVEEPVLHEAPPELRITRAQPNLTVITPQLTVGTAGPRVESVQRRMLAAFARDEGVRAPVLWFYTPMALPLAADLAPSLIVYDCMDELAAFHGAPAILRYRESELFSRAHLVFTGGHSLYEAKRARHPSVHAFPSSVDAAHFGRALTAQEPVAQRRIAGPRVGFFGVIDERMDLELVAALADARPSYQIVMLGPVVKISPDSLPKRPNLHWLGARPYEELPAWIAGWDVAMMPFALNDATRFISPTKTLEYLAAGRPVVSTAIRDVVRPYGERGLVRIADRASFARAVDEALACDLERHRREARQLLARTSWDETWRQMSRLITEAATMYAPPAIEIEEAPSCSTI